MKKQIPEYQYPLYKESDKTAYSILERLARNHPKIVGSREEINAFLKLLILSQKMKDYGIFRDIVLAELENNEINVFELLEKGKTLEIPRGIDESWAIFTQDKRICLLMDQFSDSKIEFQGSDDEIIKFIIRFLLSQLLQDWRGPKMAVLLTCLEKKTIKVSELNNLLKIWDFTNIVK